jgi:prepilin peptidase CpaA
MFIDHLPPQPIPLCVVLLAIAAASTDLVARRIPNGIVLSGLIAALGMQLWLFGFGAGAAGWCEGALAGFALLIPFYLLRGMAAGDVKLLTMIGAWVGPAMALHIALATFLIGGVWSLVVIVQHGRLRQLWQVAFEGTARLMSGTSAMTSMPTPPAKLGTLPYGVAIAAGTIGVLFVAAA